MKKIIIAVLFFSFVTITAKAEENHFYLDQPIEGIYTMMDKGYHVAANYVMPVRKVENGEYVYCVSPGVAIDPDGNYRRISDNPWETLNISKEKYEKIQIISYYGYQYGNHTDLKWYAITQYMIWQEVLPQGWSVWFTETLRGERTNSFDWMINELSNLVNSYYKNPAINNLLIGDYKINKEYIDSNNVLNNFKSSNDNVIIRNNTLIIKPTNESFDFHLDYKTNNKSSSLFIYDNAQWVVSKGDLPNKKLNYSIRIPKGSLTLSKKINDNSLIDYIPEDISLKGAKYALYNDDFYFEIETIEDGTIFMDNLNIGEYFLKEIEAPNYFKIDDKTYNITIKDQEDTYIEVIEDIIIGKLDIHKDFLDKNTFENIAEENACFELYDKNNNLITSKYTDKNGHLEFYLPIGNYSIKQIKAKEGYQLALPFNVSIIDDKCLKKEILNKPIILKKEVSNYQLIDNPSTLDNIKTNLLIFTGSIIIIVIFLKILPKKEEI